MNSYNGEKNTVLSLETKSLRWAPELLHAGGSLLVRGSCLEAVSLEPQNKAGMYKLNWQVLAVLGGHAGIDIERDDVVGALFVYGTTADAELASAQWVQNANGLEIPDGKLLVSAERTMPSYMPYHTFAHDYALVDVFDDINESRTIHPIVEMAEDLATEQLLTV